MMTGLPSGRDETVSDDEPLRRAIISKSQFTKTTRRVKPALLSPNPHLELSVSRIDGLSVEKVRELADSVARKRGKEASLGYGVFPAALPRIHRLDVVPDEPTLHHANLTGWPADSDPDEQRRLQLQTAKAMVEEVRLILWNA